MTNADNGSRLANEIRLPIAAAYRWPDKPREREAIQLPTPELEKLAGDYEAPLIGKVHIQASGDHLVITARGDDMDWYPASDTSFFNLTGGLPISTSAPMRTEM